MAFPHGVARNGPEIQRQESASAGGHRLRELHDGRQVHRPQRASRLAGYDSGTDKHS